jgi:hypothetical protein
MGHLLIIRVIWRITITQLFSNIGQLTVLPADQNVAIPGVGLDSLLHTLGVGFGARGINGEAELISEGQDSKVGAVTLSICISND